MAWSARITNAWLGSPGRISNGWKPGMTDFGTGSEKYEGLGINCTGLVYEQLPESCSL
ncbi:hypothetical protein HOE425_310045 [Hoeflea sp. EC-HK425]|nr:hypothetical protein HOE425_310045 [Hoeflea sp. EC-HK425]